MRIATEAEARRILDLPEISGSDQGDQLKYIDNPNAFYLICDGCLFPMVARGEFVSIHAAIPKSLRGKVAVNSAKKVIKWSLSQGLKVVSRVGKDAKHTQAFAKLSGLSRIKEDDEYIYYWGF